MSEVKAEELVKIYIKMRDKKAQLTKERDEISAKMDMVSDKLIELCKEVGVESLKTQYGTVSKKVDVRYWTSDWESMWEFIKEHNAYELVEKRISKLAMANFLEEHPELLPSGLNADSKYVVSIRKSTK